VRSEQVGSVGNAAAALAVLVGDTFDAVAVGCFDDDGELLWLHPVIVNAAMRIRRANR